MILEMKKFGVILNNRSAGREAILRMKQIVNGIQEDELIFDFMGVELLTPSFADEFFNGIKQSYQDKKIILRGYEDNLVIKDVLKELNLI